MALRLVVDFDLRKDVLPWLRAQGAESGGADVWETNYESLRVLNVERNGNIIYTYKDDKRNVIFGFYDCQTKQNKHLYTFEKDLQVISGSINSEKTLLAASLVQSTEERRRNELQPGSRCLTLLVEIYPVNNVKVLKAVDSYIWVQFLYPYVESHPHSQNHLLLISEEKYIEQVHIQVTQEDGDTVVIKNSDHLPRDRIAEDFVWAQWDMAEQRLYYINLKKSKSILKCIQFYADKSFNLMFETPLDISLKDLGFKLVNFGCEYHQDTLSKQSTLCVFTNHTGSLCVCYSPKFDSWEQITYSVFYLHKGYSKTFTAALGRAGLPGPMGITFLNLDLYFGSGVTGYRFKYQQSSIYHLILKIIQWISENLTACHSFDLLQEFLIASSYWSIFLESCTVAMLFPWSSVLTWNMEIPGITLVTEEIALPLMKVHSFKGYWERLNTNLQYVKYTKPRLHYHNSVVGREWHNLISEEKTGKRRATAYVRNILDNALKVISNIEARNSEPRLMPLLQEDDHHQRLLIGLMVSELKDHLLRHLQGVERKNTEQMALDYVSKLLDLICRILESAWRKHKLNPWVLHCNRRNSAAEFAVFHTMTRILEATSSLLLPLPPGFHTLHMILGVNCLPLHNLLHYVDNGVLLLTETAVTRLMKDLDNTEKNEKLKFGIIVRLPPLIGQKICRLWDHPVSSNIISRNHVTRLLQNYKKQAQNSVIKKSSFTVEFLPLNYFIEILTHLESSNQALCDFEGHDNVDAEFVEEAALKHTTMLLGL
ncbi:PREDICTED: gamma-secretase-activating protein [Dipodomys ordii]|uniref:Gamma-secretase-activating protein n=1 Tax=Dipodomys ordii TaxID=10020 RepID=A0A1S3GPB5_DIPOR|nr:PREDICTED: gamma-secretase-activating protein [Dipodomys ordii]